MADMIEIKDLVVKQGEAWEEFKTANDSRLEAIEAKGYAPEDLVEKVAKIDEALVGFGTDLGEVVKKD